MKRIFSALLALLFWGCAFRPAPAIPALPQGCTEPGEIVRAEITEPARGYPYGYRVYLPPCFTPDSGSRYPVLYLIPGRSSSPDTWFSAGLTEVLDRLILSTDIPPFILITTETIDSDPMAETIYGDLIPTLESQYPILAERRYRAVAGGSLGGIAAYRLAFMYPEQFASAGIFGAGAISGEEERIQQWLASMTSENRTRVYMDCGEEDIFMLDRARIMKSLLDEAGIENELHIGSGGHNYAYWVSNFEAYLRWMARDW